MTAKLFGATVQVYNNEYTNVVEAGDPVEYVYNNEIPSFTPSGNYLVTFDFFDANRNKVGCAGIKFTLWYIINNMIDINVSPMVDFSLRNS